VLSSASAGIIGVDASGSVGILNRSAEKLIGHAESETLDHPLSDVLPELDEMMKTAREGTQRLVQGQITITRDGHERICRSESRPSRPASRATATSSRSTTSPSWCPQRTSAWGDVARRIAHEIKNPLTRSSFRPSVSGANSQGHRRGQRHLRAVHRYHRPPGRRHQANGGRILALCADAEAGDGGRGRCRHRAAGRVLMKVGHPELDIETEIKQDPLRAQFDRRLISQALTNIIKNATEAIEQVPRRVGQGRIDVMPSARTTTS